MSRSTAIILFVLFFVGFTGFYFWKKSEVSRFIMEHDTSSYEGYKFDNPSADNITVYFDADTIHVKAYACSILGSNYNEESKTHKMRCVNDKGTVLCDTSFMLGSERPLINPTRSNYVTWTVVYLSAADKETIGDSLALQQLFIREKRVGYWVIKDDITVSNSILISGTLYNEVGPDHRKVDENISVNEAYSTGVDRRSYTLREEDFIANYNASNEISMYDEHLITLRYNLRHIVNDTSGEARPGFTKSDDVVGPFLRKNDPHSPNDFAPIIKTISSNPIYSKVPEYGMALVAYDSLKNCWDRVDTVAPAVPHLRSYEVVTYTSSWSGFWTMKETKNVESRMCDE
jgi:hypothetical protein